MVHYFISRVQGEQQKNPETHFDYSLLTHEGIKMIRVSTVDVWVLPASLRREEVGLRPELPWARLGPMWGGLVGLSLRA